MPLANLEQIIAVFDRVINYITVISTGGTRQAHEQRHHHAYAQQQAYETVFLHK